MLVSVCIPTYNRPVQLARVVDEILAQTYANIEIIITDDGDSRKTVEALGSRITKVTYRGNETRLGIYDNWNKSISLATGDLVAVYHDHDHYDPRIVAESVELFRKYPSVGIVHVATTVKMPDGSIQRPPPQKEVTPGRAFARKQVAQWASFVAHGSMMVKRRLYQTLGVFRAELGIAADMDMLVRFAQHADVGFVRAPLYTCNGRAKGDALFGHKWSDVLEYFAVRRSNIRNVYPTGPQLAFALALLQMQQDRGVVAELAAARVHRRNEILSACNAAVLASLSPVARAIATCILRDSIVSQRALTLLHEAHRGFLSLRTRE